MKILNIRGEIFLQTYPYFLCGFVKEYLTDSEIWVLTEKGNNLIPLLRKFRRRELND